MKPKPFSDALSADFDEPQNPDPTSAPSESVPSAGAQLISRALAAAKKKQKNSGNVKKPSMLGRAIAQSKRAHQSSHRYG